MLRIHEICVKKEEKSSIAFSVIQQSIEDVMQKNASSIKYRIVEEENQVRTFLEPQCERLSPVERLIKPARSGTLLNTYCMVSRI